MAAIALNDYRKAIADLVLAIARGNHAALPVVRQKLSDVMRSTMARAEIVGALRTLKRAAGVIAEEDSARLMRRQSRALRAFAVSIAEPAVETARQLPSFEFRDAAAWVLARVPQTIYDAAERTAERIAQLYGEGAYMGFVRAAEEAVTERVQNLIAEHIRRGTPERQAGRDITLTVAEITNGTADWTDAYSRMVFRTNMNTALTAGEFRAAQDPDLLRVIPCKRFDAVGDSDTRPNHLAADGIILRTTNPAWGTIAPPLGYNCRCSAVDVTLPELRRLGRVGEGGSILEDVIPSDAYPDEGFRHGGRPDLFLAGMVL